MKLIYIEWADATSPEHGVWWTECEIKRWAKEDSYWVDQVGWVLEENDKYILLAGHRSTTKSGNDIIQYGQIQKIPKTWIRKRRVIKL